MIQLKPCPFCGGEAEALDYDTSTDTWSVICKGEETNCTASVCSPISSDAAIVDWNKRTRVQVPSEVAETIRGLLESAVSGTESTIRTRHAHGLIFSINSYEWLEKYKKALTWLAEQEASQT